MTKRAVLKPLSGVFRVSKPGIDVDAATSDQLLLDERAFYGQLYLTGYAARGGASSQTISYPPLGYAPMVIVMNAFSDGRIIYPTSHKFQSGGSSLVLTATNYISQNGSLILNFQSDTSVVGSYYLIFRKGL